MSTWRSPPSALEVVRIFMLNIDRLLGFDLTGGALGQQHSQDYPHLAPAFGAGHICLFLHPPGAQPQIGALRAIRQDENVAASIGIHPLPYKVFAFVTSAFIAGVAGGLSAHLTRLSKRVRLQPGGARSRLLPWWRQPGVACYWRAPSFYRSCQKRCAS
jgi:hypothetical protein